MRVWISDFLALLYTRLLSFCLVLFAAWSAFFAGAAPAAARTNTGRLANGTTTREVQDTPSNNNKKNSIHRQNPHNPGQIGNNPPPPHPQPKPQTLNQFKFRANHSHSPCSRVRSGEQQTEQLSYPIPSPIHRHNPQPFNPQPVDQFSIPGTLNRFKSHVKSRRWPWSRLPAKEERSGTEAEERCGVQTEAEGEAANASDDSDEVTLEHAMAIAAPSSAMRACNLLPALQ